MKSKEPSGESETYSRRPQVCLTLLLAGMCFTFQANAGPNTSVSVDLTEGAQFEAAYFSGSGPNTGTGGTASDEALFGAESFEGTGLDEAELLANGVELSGPDGEVNAAELDYLLSLPALGSPAAGPEVILGPDTRSRLYTTSFPARAVALITFSGGRCTGFMIGNNTVATAGHCVHSGGPGGAWRTSVVVYPGYNGTSAPYGSCSARTLYSVTGWTLSSNEEYDYGAIKLNCTVGNSTGWFGFRTGAGSNTPAILTGYPGDKPLEMWQSSDKIRKTTARQAFYSNDTVGGMSGSPVWEDWWSGNRSRGAYANAIHAYGTHGSSPHSIYNHGTRIVSAVFRNLVTWKNAR